MLKILTTMLLLICCHTVAMGKWTNNTAGKDTVYTHDTMIIKVPEFYDVKKLNQKDTTYIIKCYDLHDSLLRSWKSFDEVRYVSIFKTYTDYSHTYKDHGKELPLPVSFIAYRYDKLGTNKWRRIEYPNQKYTELKEDAGIIVKTDVTKQRLLIQRFMPDGMEVRELSILYRYYKVSPAGSGFKD